MVQLVDVTGAHTGVASKLSVHTGAGQLHRAISVMIFRQDGRLLLQRRASSKYHFAGRWANTCCTHPLETETPEEGARRALLNELNLTCPLSEDFTFIYEARDPESDLIECEFDHVFVGVTDESPTANPEQVSEWRLIRPEALAAEMRECPTHFAPWLKEILCEASHRRVKSAPLSAFSATWMQSL